MPTKSPAGSSSSSPSSPSSRRQTWSGVGDVELGPLSTAPPMITPTPTMTTQNAPLTAAALTPVSSSEDLPPYRLSGISGISGELDGGNGGAGGGSGGSGVDGTGKTNVAFVVDEGLGVDSSTRGSPPSNASSVANVRIRIPTYFLPLSSPSSSCSSSFLLRYKPLSLLPLRYLPPSFLLFSLLLSPSHVSPFLASSL